MVERFAGERDVGGRDRQGHAVRFDLQEDRRGDVPRGIAARLERRPDPTRRERARIWLALEEVLAGELGDRAAVPDRVEERIVLLCRGAGHRHEPVRVVRGPLRQRPLLHPVGDRVDDGRVKRLVPVDGAPELPEDRRGEVLALGHFVEDVLAVDILAGMLEELLRGCNLVAGDRRDGRMTCGHVTPWCCGRTISGGRVAVQYPSVPPSLRCRTATRSSSSRPNSRSTSTYRSERQTRPSRPSGASRAQTRRRGK